MFYSFCRTPTGSEYAIDPPGARLIRAPPGGQHTMSATRRRRGARGQDPDMTGAPGSGGSETGAPCGDSYLTECETPMAALALHTRAAWPSALLAERTG